MLDIKVLNLIITGIPSIQQSMNYTSLKESRF